MWGLHFFFVSLFFELVNGASLDTVLHSLSNVFVSF